MNILFVIDKIELKYFEFNNLVTNFWLIKEFLERGNEVCITTINGLYMEKQDAFARAYQSYVLNDNIFYRDEILNLKIEDFDLVMFRPDPPVDSDYLSATYILDFVKNTKIINDPRAIRNFNEKIHTALFSDLMPKYLVSASRSRIEDFLNECGEIVLKPLNQCFGKNVMYLHIGDPNTRSIIDTLTNNENSLVMVQKYIPDIKFGDKRVLTLGDEVLSECVLKLPTNDDFKFNTHNDSYIRKSKLTFSEEENFKRVARELNKMGIPMAGLDVVNEQIIEINVTSPCYFIKEINQYFGVNLEKTICDYIQSDSIYYVKNRSVVSAAVIPQLEVNSQIVINDDSAYPYKTETF